ncbi:TonB-dependent receptor [Caulobacter sp. UNC358MFTsu5.1]|uniref:TonB-dependent receptor n=1 Tax=Caulobacter sp. UNC358MFTsu5.1 TaxID=1449049 RepID=UPI0012DEED6F|nr:TonB-dependent receptor [Caulobacter sp. UNC358MFTsu5.1]
MKHSGLGSRRRQTAGVLALVLAVGQAGASHAADAIALDMPAQSLSLTLKRVARAGSAELAFDRAVTDKLRAPGLKGRYTVDQALAAALASTGLGVQRTSDGAYVIKPMAGPPPARPPVDAGDGAVSEILVLGRRNLNTGIRRTRDDIQPYDVALEEAIRRAGDLDVEGFIRRTMPADAQAGALTQSPAANSASARSRIDLLGLGGGQTLVLVDGRRLPSAPEAVGASAGFIQADVNGIPLAAVERIEVLTAAAGALYGPGATGGVVNIVLKRDYQGAEVKLAQGGTEHGGGLASRLDAAIGRTSSDGRGGLSVRIALGRDQGLDVGERLFGERALTSNGADFIKGGVPKAYVPVGLGVNVVSSGGQLTLKPAYGGQALGSTFTTFSTAGFTAAEAVANAGRLDLDLPDDAFGEKQSLMTETYRRSLVVSGRQEAGIFEGFFDYLFLDNRGRATVPAGDTVLTMSASSPLNPFEQSVYVSRSVPWEGIVRNRSATQKLDAGLIARLPRGWMAEADAGWSRSQVRVANDARGATVYAGTSTAVSSGLVGPSLSPFDPEDLFLETYSAYRLAGGSLLKLSDTLEDLNLRASGPLWRLPGGPLTMTLSAEAARERAPGGQSFSYDRNTGLPKTVQGNRLGLTTRSAAAEWRAPLTTSDAWGPFKDLELQAALRADDYRMTAPRSDLTLDSGGIATLSQVAIENLVVAKMVGVKTFVTDGVMLRASYSEGHLPPRSDQVQPTVLSLNGTGYPKLDPKRDGQPLAVTAPMQLVQAGSPDLDPELARTFSLGVVIKPRWLDGARLSIDYQRTEKTREITEVDADSIGYILAHEALYPSRVVRAPLTDADRAKGYTVGAVTYLDATMMNVGRSIAETVDVSGEYRRRLAGGEVSAYLRGVWQPSYRRQVHLDGPWTETAGYSDGPLRVRAFAGGQWTGEALTVGLNARYYASYAVADSGLQPLYITQYLARLKGGRIPSQVYLDAFAAWSVGEKTEVQLTVRNLADATPPFAFTAAMGYSPYGDADGRAFEISLTRRF